MSRRIEDVIEELERRIEALERALRERQPSAPALKGGTITGVVKRVYAAPSGRFVALTIERDEAPRWLTIKAANGMVASAAKASIGDVVEVAVDAIVPEPWERDGRSGTAYVGWAQTITVRPTWRSTVAGLAGDAAQAIDGEDIPF